MIDGRSRLYTMCSQSPVAIKNRPKILLVFAEVALPGRKTPSIPCPPFRQQGVGDDTTSCVHLALDRFCDLKAGKAAMTDRITAFDCSPHHWFKWCIHIVIRSMAGGTNCGAAAADKWHARFVSFEPMKDSDENNDTTKSDDSDHRYTRIPQIGYSILGWVEEPWY